MEVILITPETLPTIRGGVGRATISVNLQKGCINLSKALLQLLQLPKGGEIIFAQVEKDFYIKKAPTGTPGFAIKPNSKTCRLFHKTLAEKLINEVENAKQNTTSFIVSQAIDEVTGGHYILTKQPINK